jgi:DNA-binding MarR family transcriptional regulator
LADDHLETRGALARMIRDWSVLRPDLEPAAFSIMMHIGHLSLLLGQVSDQLAAEFDINQLDVRLMMAIKRDQGGKPGRPSELGDRLDLSRAAITYRVDRLLELGLARRVADPTDRRALFVTLTPKGEAIIAKLMTRYAEMSEQKLQKVDRLPGGRRALEAMLRALAEAFEVAGEPVTGDA